MDFLSALVLGLVQGLTEFLPVSSSGHLIIAREILGLQTTTGLFVDATLHFATALAVLIYFRTDFKKLVGALVQMIRRKPVEVYEKTLLLALIVGTIPAVALGLLLENSIETVFRSAEVVAWALVGGSLLFLVAEYVSKRIKATRELSTAVSVKQGFLIGAAQALSLIPGVSRSGATISAGLMLGLTREQAARFAFLLSFPIILGAGGVSALKLEASGAFQSFGLPILVAAITAFVTGLLAIHYLLKYLRNHTLNLFVVYRIALALGIFGVLWF